MSIGKISVIVPVYNGEKYLDRCINSIVNQTYENIEIIIVNDGSTDNSGAICEKWKEKDERILVIHASNGGVSRARNIALDFSKGEYVAFVDADDWLSIDMYECMIKAIRQTQADICACSYVLSVSGRDVIACEENVAQMLNRDEAILAVYAGNIKKRMGWELCDKLFKSFLFDDLRFQVTRKVAEDELIFWKLMKRVNKVYYIPLNKYHYFMRKDSAVHTITIKSILDRVNVARYIYKDSFNEADNIVDAVRMRYYITLASSIRKMLLYFKLTKTQQNGIKIYSNIIRKNICFILMQNCDLIYKLSAIYVCFPLKIQIMLKNIMRIYKTRECLY